jgi:hypothetical protein
MEFVCRFVGAFPLRKVTTSFSMSVCPVRPHETTRLHWADFHEILYLSIFRNSVGKFQVSLKPDKNDR